MPGPQPGESIMLFMVQMQVNLPVDMPAERADKLKADERPWRSSCSATASGRACGAWSAATPTSASSTWKATTSCTPCWPRCRVPVHGHPGDGAGASSLGHLRRSRHALHHRDLRQARPPGRAPAAARRAPGIPGRQQGPAALRRQAAGRRRRCRRRPVPGRPGHARSRAAVHRRRSFAQAGLFERVAITRWRKAYVDGVCHL